MNSKRVVLLMSDEKVKELKKKAIDADVSLSQYLITAGTITPIEKIKEAKYTGGAVTPNEVNV